MISPLIRLMRPNQWVKNVFVLAALVFSRHLFESPYVIKTAVAFTAFCLISSATYVFNDITDRERDQNHPAKMDRPVASGAVLPGTAALLGTVILIPGLIISLSLGRSFLIVAGSYIILQVAYNLILRQIVLLDIISIALGFVLRAVAGAAAIDVYISPWLILCTLLVALFLGFAKRRHEIVILGDSAGDHRDILEEYTIPFLDQLITIVTATTIVAYSIYTLSPDVTEKVGNRYMILTLPFVIYGIFRYLYLVNVKEKGGNPSKDLLSDGPLLLSIFLYGLAAVAVLYIM